MKKIFLKTFQKKYKISSDDVLVDFFINREGAMRRDHLLQKTKSEELGRRRRKSPKRCLRPFSLFTILRVTIFHITSNSYRQVKYAFLQKLEGLRGWILKDRGWWFIARDRHVQNHRFLKLVFHLFLKSHHFRKGSCKNFSNFFLNFVPHRKTYYRAWRIYW